MKKSVQAILFVLSVLLYYTPAQALEYTGSEFRLNALYRTPVEYSWGVQAQAELWERPKLDQQLQYCAVGFGWYCGSRWCYANVGLLRNWFAPDDDAIMWGLQGGLAIENGDAWVEAKGDLVQSRNFPRQFHGRYQAVGRVKDLVFSFAIEQRNLNMIRLGPGLGLMLHRNVWVQGTWFVGLDKDHDNIPPEDAVVVALSYRYPWPGKRAKLEAGYPDN